MTRTSASVRGTKPPIGSPSDRSSSIRSSVGKARIPWRRQRSSATRWFSPRPDARSLNRRRAVRPGSPYHRATGVRASRPQSPAASTTSSPTLRQSESLPPRIDTTPRVRSTSTACRRDSSVQSRPSADPPGSTARERTPQRSAITSAAVSGRGRSIRALICSSRNDRSSPVTDTSGSSTGVSVVPITERSPIGST